MIGDTSEGNGGRVLGKGSEAHEALDKIANASGWGACVLMFSTHKSSWLVFELRT